MPKSVAKLGFWSAVLTTILTVLTFGIAYFTPPLSGPFCTSSCFEYHVYRYRLALSQRLSVDVSSDIVDFSIFCTNGMHPLLRVPREEDIQPDWIVFSVTFDSYIIDRLFHSSFCNTTKPYKRGNRRYCIINTI